jgi:hypothetical protein
MTDESKEAKRPRGRPKGARNIVEPHGARRAREYLDLTYTGEKPNRAAARVAEKHGVGVEAIFNSVRRHEPRLAAEEWRRAEIIMQDLRDKAAGFVVAGDVENAFHEAQNLICACLEQRLNNKVLQKALAGMGEAEAREHLSGVIRDARLEIAHRLADRAEEMPQTVDGRVPYSNGAKLVFERLAEALKPNLK